MGKGITESELHAAARSGDLSAVESILSSNPLLVNSRDKHSRTPLHLAAWSGKEQVVSYLCNHKADVGAAAMDDMGAIHFAAQKGHVQVVQMLISSGASVKACTRKGLTPLHYAVQNSHMELVKYLIKKGASLTMKTKAGKTPLDLAGTEELRLFIEECQHSCQKGKNNEKDKQEESDSKTDTNDKLENSSYDEDKEDGSIKRKGAEGNSEEDFSEAKRAKVSLGHLLSADDTEETGDV